MKTAFFVAGLVVCLVAGLVIAEQGNASAERARTQVSSVGEPVTESPEVYANQICRLEVALPDFLSFKIGHKATPLSKKCSFNSDCSHGKCAKSKCGACSFNSDCKGWGKCSKGKCGSCSFDSECKDFGKCSKGKCTKSPYKK